VSHNEPTTRRCDGATQISDRVGVKLPYLNEADFVKLSEMQKEKGELYLIVGSWLEGTEARFPRRSVTIFNLVQIVRRRRQNVSTMDMEKSEGNVGVPPK